MKKCLVFLAIASVCVAVESAALADYVLSGQLTLTENELDGTGEWVDIGLVPESNQSGWVSPTFSWDVTLKNDGNWHYVYELSAYENNVSHLIIEASPAFVGDNLFNATGAFNTIVIGEHKAGSGNPGMLSDMYGIKFSATTGSALRVEFDSDHAPIWGDFYAKGVGSALWDSGFDGTPPSYSGADGQIMVPDTSKFVATVPTPGSLMLLLSGVPALGLLIRRRTR